MAKLKFSFPAVQQPAEITFSSGALKVLADADLLRDAVVMISGHPSVRQYWTDVLRAKGVEVAEERVCVKPAGEPTRDAIRLGAEFLQRQQMARLIGIGGGSVLDWCRLAWAQSQGLLMERAGRFLVEERNADRPELWLVPTTCATGAEAASVAVFSDQGRKVPVVSRRFVADHVVLDGHVLNGQSNGELALSLCDALSHGIEAYVSLIPNALAKEAACSAVWRILEHFFDDHDPASRRERLLEAAYLGGLAAGHCSVGIVHAFAHTVSSSLSHAHANALGLIAGIQANSEVPALQTLATRVGCGSVEGLIKKLRPFVRLALEQADSSDILRQLGDASSRKAIIEGMLVDPCLRTNPRPLSSTDLERFLAHVSETITTANC